MSAAAINYSILRSCLRKGISFAAYSLPGETKFTFIAQKNQAKSLDPLNRLDQGFLIHPFEVDTSHPKLLIKNDFFLKEGDENKNLVQFIQSKKDYSKPAHSAIIEQSKEGYLESFNQFKQVLDDGTFKKLVLSRVKNSRVDNSFDIVDLFKKLNRKYTNSFNHLLFTPQSGIWLGASPEILLSVGAKKARTVALAGTQKKAKIFNYAWESKEIEEQKFVIDFVKETLHKHIPKSSIETTNETVEAGKMVHLQTKFSFPSKHIKNLPAFLNDLHPTPAVCGLPKEKAKQFILENESHERAYYSGFLGPINMNNQTHLFVNLRCLNLNGETLSLFLGGGLTKDSIAEMEWEETELKATTLESLL